MTLAQIDGIPVLLFTRRLSARRWEFMTSLDRDADDRYWSVIVSPRMGTPSDHVPFARIHIERADGRIEGQWSSGSSRGAWTYSRMVSLDRDEKPPALVLHEFLLPRRLAFARRRLPGAK